MSIATFLRLADDVKSAAKFPISQNITKKVVGTLNFTSIDGNLKPGLNGIIKTSKNEGLNTINARLTDLVSDKKIISDSELDDIINTTVDDQIRTYTPQEITRLLNEGGVDLVTFKNDIKTQMKNELDNIIKNDVLNNPIIKQNLENASDLIKNNIITEKTIIEIEEIKVQVEGAGGFDQPPKDLDDEKAAEEISKDMKELDELKKKGASPDEIKEKKISIAKKWGKMSLGKKVSIGLTFIGVLVTGIVLLALTANCVKDRDDFGTKIINLERDGGNLIITIEQDMYENLCKSDKVNIQIYSNYIRNNDSLDFNSSTTITLLANNRFSINPGDWDFFQKIPAGVATNDEGYGYIDLDSSWEDCFKCSVVRTAGGVLDIIKDAADDAIGDPVKGLINAIKKAAPWVIGVIALIIIIFILKIFLSR